MSDEDRIRRIIETCKDLGSRVTQIELLPDGGVKVMLVPLGREEDPLEQERRENIEREQARADRKRKLGIV